MIDLTKKYKNKHGCDVVLYDIIDNIVFGRFYDQTLQLWNATQWGLYTAKCHFSLSGDKYDLVEVPAFSVKFDNTSVVDYFGLKLTVSKEYNYLATDADGEIYSYEKEPSVDDDGFWTRLEDSPSTFVANIKYDGDWRKSLMEIKQL